MDKKDKIVKLINKIDSGRINADQTARILDAYEKEYGPLNMIYDVAARDDDKYYEELLDDARIGIYNRQSLIKMAEIKSRNGSTDISQPLNIAYIVFEIIMLVAFWSAVAITGGNL